MASPVKKGKKNNHIEVKFLDRVIFDRGLEVGKPPLQGIIGRAMSGGRKVFFRKSDIPDFRWTERQTTNIKVFVFSS